MSRYIMLTNEEIDEADKYLTDCIEQLTSVHNDLHNEFSSLNQQKSLTIYKLSFYSILIIAFILTNQIIINNFLLANYAEPMIAWISYWCLLVYLCISLLKHFVRFIIIKAMINDEFNISRMIKEFKNYRETIINTSSNPSFFLLDNGVIPQTTRPIDESYLSQVKSRLHNLDNFGLLERIADKIQILGVSVFALYMIIYGINIGFDAYISIVGLPLEFSNLVIFSEYIAIPYVINLLVFITVSTSMVYIYFWYLKFKTHISLNIFTYFLGLTSTPIAYLVMIFAIQFALVGLWIVMIIAFTLIIVWLVVVFFRILLDS
jgi:hypothetical protein